MQQFREECAQQEVRNEKNIGTGGEIFPFFVLLRRERKWRDRFLVTEMMAHRNNNNNYFTKKQRVNVENNNIILSSSLIDLCS